jgi:hypothetical protein
MEERFLPVRQAGLVAATKTVASPRNDSNKKRRDDARRIVNDGEKKRRVDDESKGRIAYRGTRVVSRISRRMASACSDFLWVET